MSINENVIIISSDSDDTDIEELRKMAINSMIKQEKREPYISGICEEHYKEPVNYQINVYSSFLSRKRSSSVISNEDTKKPKIEESVDDSVENIIKDGLLEVFDINNILNYSKTDNSINLLKEEELKNKLLKALRTKEDLNRSKNEILPISHSVTEISYDMPLYESDDDNFDIFTHAILPSEEITDPNVLKYHNLITEVKLNIDEVIKSINTISASIQEKLIKSKKITTQIENLKNQKTELHREISVNRRKVLDLHKIKKQKSTDLINFEFLKRKFTENQISSVSRNVEFIDSLSTVSCETSDSKSSYYDIDCNHLICPVWLNSICTNKCCIYQHPKFSSKPVKNPPIRIKENDKVFLKEMNATGFICKLKCEACSINIFMSTLHIEEDSYCKSCCQQLISLKNPADILNQLILIWHHFYKRYIKSKTRLSSFDNRELSISILQNLYKCSEAMKAKLTTVVNLPSTLFICAGCHVILTLNEETKIDDLLTFLKSVNFNFQLVLFACKRLSFPVPKLYQLLIETVFYHIKNSIFTGIPLILKEFCIFGRNLGLFISNELFKWLEMSIQMNCHESIIDCLVEIILREIIGSEFVPQITLSMHELDFGDKYWLDRKESLIRIAKLVELSGLSSENINISRDLTSRRCRVLSKYVILLNFFTGNEQEALELCEKQIDRGYFYLILNSKLSLNYNSPVMFNETDKMRLIEYTFNKSEWLVTNRSIKSSVKLLETVPHILYKISRPIENSKQALDLYELFLEIRSSPTIIGREKNPNSNLSESESKMILNQSAIWMCYINLAVLATKLDGDGSGIGIGIGGGDRDSWVFDQILRSNRIIFMIPEHLNRLTQFIIIQFSEFCTAAQYYKNLRRILLFIDRSLEFVHFLDSFYVIDFGKLHDYQLQTWLFLIDFCIERFSQDSVDQFLVIISQRLAQTSRNNISVVGNLATSGQQHRQILHHIIMCYPIRSVDVWINYVRLLMNLADSCCGGDSSVVPLYELIDTCNMSVTQFAGSRFLWQYYHDCVVKSGDEELLKKIKGNAVKHGFELSQR